MLYFIYGKDSFRSRQKLNDLVSYFKTKVSNLGFFKIERDDFDFVEIEELARSQTLFEKKYVVVCDRVIGDQAARNFLEKNIEKISSSPNIFIFLEDEMEDKTLSLFKEHSQKVQKFDLLTGSRLKKWIQDKAPKTPFNIQEEMIKICGSDLWCISKEIEKYELSEGQTFANREGLTFAKYNPFAICDAVAEKDKNKAWVLFQRAIFSGVPAEEVFYKIVWQIKNLLLLKKLSAFPQLNLEKETGLHPFVIKKNMYAIHNFTEEELKKYSFELIKIYHDTRRGLEDFSLGLEKFLFNLN